jgi:hypothetical protein
MYSKRLLLPFILTILILSCQSPESKIQKTFLLYKDSILASSAENAVLYLDSDTVKYYDKLITDSLYVSKETLTKRPILNKFLILRLRLSFTKDELQKMDGNTLLKKAIELGWIGKDSVDNVELGNIHLLSDHSYKVEVNSNGMKTGDYLYFTKESGMYKLNLAKTISWTEKRILSTIKMIRQSESEYLDFMIKTISGRILEEKDWQPIISNK